MTTTATKPVTAVQVAEFLRSHLPQAGTLLPDEIVPWVAWFLRADRALVLTDEQDKICGVALGRFVHAAEDARKAPQLFDVPTGRVLWVDAIATTQAAAMPQMLAIMAKKYGPRETVAGECFSRAGELRMFPMKTLTRFFGVTGVTKT